MLLSGTHRCSRRGRSGRRRDGAHRPAWRLRRRDAGLHRERGAADLHRDVRGRSATCGFFVLRRRRLRRRRPRVVPDGDPPARGPVPRHAQLAADRRPAPAAARARRAVRRPDARAQQPGGRSGAGDRRAARAGRGHAAQAGDARARRDRPRELLELLVDVQEEAVQAVADRARAVAPSRSPSARTSSTDWLDGARRHRRLGAGAGLRRGRHDDRRSSTSSRRGAGRSCSTAPCAGSPTRWRPSCCWARSPTR